MLRCHLDSLPWEEQRTPTGKFHSFCRNVSLALGGKRNTGLWGGGHPFDVQIRRIPPKAAVCPFHSHLAQWEFFVIRAGHATVRSAEETHTVGPGDVFVHPPHVPHQLINSGDTDLEVLIIADNPQLDACYYPDSRKWGLRPPGKFFRMNECTFVTGEDDAPSPDGKPYRPAPPAALPVIAPFLQRKAAINDLTWENFDSPKRTFRGESKTLSAAVGAKENTPIGLGGHPFDIELGRVPAGFSSCPFHSHAAQWELYLFVQGTGTVRTVEGRMPIGPGDVVLHPPREAHQFLNTGSEPLEYLLVADNPIVDIWFYPDSNKWGFNSPRKFFRPSETTFWEGEE
jgi:uncharacterized cupin superfamily protein